MADCKHEYQKARFEWQTVDYARYQVLQHAREVFICIHCGDYRDPFKREEEVKKNG